MSEIEDLHYALFKFRPKKRGTAYERVTAVVLAALGWTDIRYDRHERAAGKLVTRVVDSVAVASR
jgi:hypothetical protein